MAHERAADDGAVVQPRVTVVTLGVADVPRSRRFYVDGLGWPVRFEGTDVLMLDVDPGLVLSLWDLDAMREEIGEVGAPGLAPVTLAHNLKEPADVDATIAAAVAAGGRLVSAGVRREWGGYSGYVADPDGYRWEIAVNPDWPDLVPDDS